MTNGKFYEFREGIRRDRMPSRFRQARKILTQWTTSITIDILRMLAPAIASGIILLAWYVIAQIAIAIAS